LPFRFNTLQHSRAWIQSKKIVEQQHDDRKLTATDIQTMLASLWSLPSGYTSILSSTSLWTDHHDKSEGPPRIFTLIAADLQWPDLCHNLLNPPMIPELQGKVLNRNPHIAGEYLDKRLKISSSIS